MRVIKSSSSQPQPISIYFHLNWHTKFGEKKLYKLNN
uniref:Uncharacterized protein n=1 Tax=Anguilla anguilla TaxID=7936 RepID=A0A0E9UED5_ANGAN